MKKTSLIFLTSLALFLISSQKTLAFETKTADNVSLRKDETINGTLYAAGSTVTIDGNVKGDLICAAQTVTVNGKVDGDIVCAAETINLNGQVADSARLAGQTININGNIGHNLQAFAATLNLNEKAAVAWDVFVAADNAVIDGKIAGSLHGALRTVQINSQIGQDVKLRLGGEGGKSKPGLVITDKATVKGNLFYTAVTPADISPGAKINGQVSYSLTVAGIEKDAFFVIALGKLVSIFSALVVGLVLISLWREAIIATTDNMLARSGLSFGTGTVVLALTPIIALILVFTIICIPLAVIMACLWLIALYIAKINTGIMLGRLLLRKTSKEGKSSLIWAMIAGIIILWTVSALPLIGWLASLAAIVWGLGGIYLYAKGKLSI